MGIVIDSSVFVAAERQRLDLAGFLQKEVNLRTAFISSITATELLHGVERAVDGKKKGRRGLLVEAVLNDFPIIPFGIDEARIHSVLWADLKKKGEIIGPHDLLIAATAFAGKHSLATLNVGEFERVKGLSVIDASSYLTEG